MAKKEKTWEFKPFESKTKNGRHLRITLNMMESAAWKKLNSQAIQIYLLMKIKYTGANEEQIIMTYKEGMQYMTQRKVTAALDQLIDFGFIEIIEHRQNTREPNIYGFSDMWQHWGTDKFHVQPRSKKGADSTGRLKST